jgi:uncharacterized protein YndB with AHSA1/START domain
LWAKATNAYLQAMAQRFEITQDLEVDASPQDVWEAVATGPGRDSWFMGRNEIEPRQGGRVGFSVGDFTAEARVTVWKPPEHLVSTSDPAPDGTFHQFEYRIEERSPGRSAIRYEHTGMLGGEWEAEYEAMRQGDPMYLDKLVQYLTYFRGRFATPLDVQGPQVPSREHAMRAFRRGLGVSEDAALGDHVHLVPEGLAAEDGAIDYVSPNFLGVRTEDALYRFIYGFTGVAMIGHHLFIEGIDQARAESDWRSWLEGLFAAG